MKPTHVSAALVLLALGCANPGSSAGSRPALDLTLEDRLPPDSCTAHWVAGVRGRVVDSKRAAWKRGTIHSSNGVRLA